MNQNELTHYGVKGIKWGVRRSIAKRSRKAAKLERKASQKYERERTYESRATKANNPNRAAKNKQKAKNVRAERKTIEKERDKLVTGISKKDIDQGRRYLTRRDSLIYTPLGGAVFSAHQRNINEQVLERYRKDTGR